MKSVTLSTYENAVNKSKSSPKYTKHKLIPLVADPHKKAQAAYCYSQKLHRFNWKKPRYIWHRTRLHSTNL